MIKKYEEEKEHKIYCRKKTENGEEEIILDVNLLAKGKEFCDVTEVQPSPDNKLLSYAIGNFYNIFILVFNLFYLK